MLGGSPKGCSAEGLAGWLSPPWFSALFFWNLLDPLSACSGLPCIVQEVKNWLGDGAAQSPGVAVRVICMVSFRLGSFCLQGNLACVSVSFQMMPFLLDTIFCSETLQD